MSKIKIEFPGLKKIFDDLVKEANKKDFGKVTPNKLLITHLNKIVDKIIIKKARKEAKSLLKLANKNEIGDFLYYHYSGMDNIPCSVLDSIKDRLFGEKKLPKSIGKQFGLKIKDI
jgi:hypothetical protein